MGKMVRIIAVFLSLGLVSSLTACAHSAKSETAGQYVDDSMITTKVKAALLREPGLSSMQIKVNTYEGVVQLSGFVDSIDNARRAGQVASTVNGVRDVRNDLIVK